MFCCISIQYICSKLSWILFILSCKWLHAHGCIYWQLCSKNCLLCFLMLLQFCTYYAWFYATPQLVQLFYNKKLSNYQNTSVLFKIHIPMYISLYYYVITGSLFLSMHCYSSRCLIDGRVALQSCGCIFQLSVF